MTLNLYLATAMVLAPLIFLITEWIGHEPLPSHRLFYSLIAAGLWPVLVVGAAQVGLIVAVRRLGRSPIVDPPSSPVETRIAIPAR